MVFASLPFLVLLKTISAMIAVKVAGVIKNLKLNGCSESFLTLALANASKQCLNLSRLL